MVFTAFANTTKACLLFDWNAVEVSFCVHFDRTGYTDQEAEDLSFDVAEAWFDNLAASQSEDIQLINTTVYDLTEEGAPKYVSTNRANTTGLTAVDSTPNNAGPVLSHRSTTTGRSGRGRTYFPGTPDTSVVDGVLESAYLALLVTRWLGFVGDIESTGWDFVIAQRFDDDVQLTTGVTRQVTTEILRDKLGTQRRRQAG